MWVFSVTQTRILCITAIFAVLAVVTLGCGQSKRVSLQQAEVIAHNHLVAFCKQDELDVHMFSRPYIMGPKDFSGVKWWIFQYRYDSKPNAKILIDVSEYGESNISGMGPGIPGVGSRKSVKKASKHM